MFATPTPTVSNRDATVPRSGAGANRTAVAPTSVPHTPPSKVKRTKACQQCRKLRCKCKLVDETICERCFKKSLPCSGPTETPERLKKLRTKVRSRAKTVMPRIERNQPTLPSNRAFVTGIVHIEHSDEPPQMSGCSPVATQTCFIGASWIIGQDDCKDA